MLEEFRWLIDKRTVASIRDLCGKPVMVLVGGLSVAYFDDSPAAYPALVVSLAIPSVFGLLAHNKSRKSEPIEVSANLLTVPF